LVAGQELRVEPDGRALLVPDADIAAAIAWRQGIVIFKDTLLSDAVRELNRHSRLQIRIGDPALGALRVSGVFESRDTQGFLEAVQSFLPVIAAQEGPDIVRLSPVRESD
jgi:transmembrane sensor